MAEATNGSLLSSHGHCTCSYQLLRGCQQAEVRVAREKGRRRGALAAKQESELAAAQAEVAAGKSAAESAQRIANAAADDKKRLQVLSLKHAAQSGVALLVLLGSQHCMHTLLRSTCRHVAPATAVIVADLRYAS